MKCPVCGTRHMEVLQTRREPDETIRVRQCFNEHKFETTEQVTRVIPKGRGAHLRKNTMERMVAVHQSDWPGAEATE
jgi:transcriptional regulator NrdR family protein